MGEGYLPADPASEFARKLSESLLPGGPHGDPTIEWVTPECFVAHYSGRINEPVSWQVTVAPVPQTEGDLDA
jgi:hypothetical protein